MSIPAILLAIALMAVTGGSVLNVIVAVTIVEIPRVARLIRGIALSLREQPYVEAAIAAGTSRPMIMVRHLLPGIVPPLIVQATFVWATAMILEAALSFIGAGTPPTTPSWGNILADARALWQIRPTLVFFPGVFLFTTLLAVNMLGDGLRDLLDPRQAPQALGNIVPHRLLALGRDLAGIGSCSPSTTWSFHEQVSPRMVPRTRHHDPGLERAGFRARL